MAQNLVQFQKGLSLLDFLKEYETEEACRQALEQWRWPQGFIVVAGTSRYVCAPERFCSAATAVIKPR